MRSLFVVNMSDSFDFDLFCDSKAAEAFKCMICLGVPKTAAHLSTCGHLGCEECLKTWFVTKNGDTCPICKVPAKADNVQPNAFAGMLIRGLEVTCPNDGCGNKMMLGKRGEHLATHRHTCVFEPTPCIDCKKSVPRGTLEQHKQHECRNRLIECKSCGEQVAAYLMDVHTKRGSAALGDSLLLCTGLAYCPNACSFRHNGSAALPRSVLQGHIKQCPKRAVECPVCQVPFTLLEFGAHMTAFPSHAATTLDRLHASEKRAHDKWHAEQVLLDDELQAGLRRFSAFYVAVDSDTPPRRLSWIVPKAASSARIKADVSRVINAADCNTNTLIVAEVYKHRLHKVYAHDAGIDAIEPDDDIWVYHNPRHLECGGEHPWITVQAVLATPSPAAAMVDADKPLKCRSFGVPLIVALPEAKLRTMPPESLRAALNGALRPFIQGGWRAGETDAYEIHVFDKATKELQFKVVEGDAAAPIDLTMGTGKRGFSFVLLFQSATLFGRYWNDALCASLVV